MSDDLSACVFMNCRAKIADNPESPTRESTRRSRNETAPHPNELPMNYHCSPTSNPKHAAVHAKRLSLPSWQDSREPAQRISEDAQTFLESWEDVEEILDAATPEEQAEILRHYIEVVELQPSEDGKTGTYVLKLFPEIRVDRGFDWDSANSEDGSPPPQTQNGAVTDDDDPALLTREDEMFAQVSRKLPSFDTYRNFLAKPTSEGKITLSAVGTENFWR